MKKRSKFKKLSILFHSLLLLLIDSASVLKASTETFFDNPTAVEISADSIPGNLFLAFWSPYLLLLGLSIFIVWFLLVFRARLRYTRKLEMRLLEKTKQFGQFESKYRSIFDHSLDPVTISNSKGSIVDANPAAVELFGYSSKEEFLKVKSEQLYSNPEDRSNFIETIHNKGFVKDMELKLKKKDGQPFIVILSSTLQKTEDEDEATYLGIMKDVTQRWQLKDQLAQAQKMESIGMLAGGIAHDFNNILGGILGYASLMKLQLSEEDKFYKFVDSIEKSAVRGADLTNQLLVFARRGEARLSTVSLNQVIKDTSNIIRSTFPKAIELEMNLEEPLANIQADEAQLHQILMNLCVNARDAIRGSGRINLNTKSVYITEERARQHNDVSKGNFILLEVIDDGIGMEQSTIKHIFEPFFSTKEQGKGSGLGLSMIYGFVRSHNGFIDVESNPGKGSIFRIFLPSTDEHIVERKEHEMMPETGNELILVVDDEKILRDFLKQALEGYGYEVLLAADGQQGIELYKQFKDKIQLIILDMIMPVLSGEQTLRKIRELDKEIKVLIASGYSEKDKFEKIGQLHIAGILHKPFRINKLLSQIRTILDN